AHVVIVGVYAEDVGVFVGHRTPSRRRGPPYVETRMFSRPTMAGQHPPKRGGASIMLNESRRPVRPRNLRHRTRGQSRQPKCTQPRDGARAANFGQMTNA